MLLKKDEIETSNAEQKWNNHFSNENINWKKIYLINISTSNDMKLRDFQYRYLKVSKGAKIRNRYNQVPHLTQDTKGKVTNSQ